MQEDFIDDAVASLEKANAGLQPELLTAERARTLLSAYAKAEKLAAFGRTVSARKVDDVQVLARATGTSVGKAKQVVETAKALQDAGVVAEAFAGGAISLAQATEIARAEKAQPGSATELLSVASGESFQVLREKSRKVVLEAGQHRGLGERQREARTAHHYYDELGMKRIDLTITPELGERSAAKQRPKQRVFIGLRRPRDEPSLSSVISRTRSARCWPAPRSKGTINVPTSRSW